MQTFCVPLFVSYPAHMKGCADVLRKRFPQKTSRVTNTNTERKNNLSTDLSHFSVFTLSCSETKRCRAHHSAMQEKNTSLIKKWTIHFQIPTFLFLFWNQVIIIIDNNLYFEVGLCEKVMNKPFWRACMRMAKNKVDTKLFSKHHDYKPLHCHKFCITRLFTQYSVFCKCMETLIFLQKQVDNVKLMAV